MQDVVHAALPYESVDAAPRATLEHQISPSWFVVQ
jgi:hypothetical protein